MSVQAALRRRFSASSRIVTADFSSSCAVSGIPLSPVGTAVGIAPPVIAVPYGIAAFFLADSSRTSNLSKPSPSPSSMTASTI